jgi:hypothetical protein
MIRRVLRIMVSFLSIFLVHGVTPAYADTPPEVVFILDASGSMWGQCEGETKIEAARRVLAEMLPRIPPEVRVGLAAYGHRRKSDCSDVEIIVPPGSDDRDAVLNHVRELTPKGMTPIADSVKQVVEAVKTREAETTIILISDGEETCHPDPCEMIRSLKSTGTKFVLHVVGFGVNEKQTEQLTCFAQAGGGRYSAAGDAHTLLAALESIKDEVVEKVEKAKTTAKTAVSRLGKLQVRMPESSEISIHMMKILRKSDGKVLKTVERPSADSVHPVLAGEYELVMGFANPNYAPPTDVSFGTWQVSGGETTEVVLGALILNIADAFNSMSIDSVILRRTGSEGDFLTLSPHGNGYYLFKPKPLPPGTYTFLVQYHKSPDPTEIGRDIQVEAGRGAVLTIDSGISLVESNSGLTGWDLVPPGGQKPVLAVRRRWDNQEPLWRRFAVPPGTYDIIVHIKGMDEGLPVGEEITISSGDLVEFDTGL